MVSTDGLDVTAVVSAIGVLTDVYTFVVPGSVCVIGRIEVVASAVDTVVPVEAMVVVVFRTEGFVIAVVVWVSPVTTPDVVSGVTVVTCGAEVVVSTVAVVEVVTGPVVTSLGGFVVSTVRVVAAEAVVSTGLAVVPLVVVDGT